MGGSIEWEMRGSLLLALWLVIAGCGGGGGNGGSNIGVTTGLDLADAFPNLPAFEDPLFLAPVPAPDTRLVVVEQTGRVKVFEPATSMTTSNVLDVSSLIVSGGEQGLLGFAFDPNFASNHFVYVNYTRTGDGATVIARYTWDGTNTVNLSTAKTILTVAQPGANHNGGMIAFGPDGFLYIGFGDGGGSAGSDNGQDLNSLLAKILRIDVHRQDAGKEYAIPADNPFVGNANARPEIWALGFRNPFRFSFDRGTNELWVGDVGQNQFEEIDIVTKGKNYGWPAFEGPDPYLNVPLASGTTHTPPIFAYDHGKGIAIIGGYVYRGSGFGSLVGRYIYTDFGSGTVWSIDRNGQNNAEIAQGGRPTSFGEDNAGELYIVDQNGRVYRFQNR